MSDLVEEFTLETLFLNECRVVRGEADEATPGRVEQNIDVEFSVQDVFIFDIRAGFRFLNADEVLVAQIEASFVASYSYEGARPGQAEIEDFANGPLLVTAVPFIREFLASMTNRLALPTFYLPIFAHRGSIGRIKAGYDS
ncbi:hypothetical protein [Actinoplanes couchii]|uniref:Preprotein translocase subunit SecB n=1 Tax=Actinoplanes couchii TaxID=403638 RepID=A0ABQ3X782_9ACTN|nr:hypothetical protein [Actinoplanes couchii]MDR6322191.1 hypothetical protein [Actinoplanes couchii]GID54356.1 hypothetical protein Aco03nite_027600 [Actinoplanes couchii]